MFYSTFLAHLCLFADNDSLHFTYIFSNFSGNFLGIKNLSGFNDLNKPQWPQ